jgi:hypothetical protein
MFEMRKKTLNISGNAGAVQTEIIVRSYPTPFCCSAGTVYKQIVFGGRLKGNRSYLLSTSSSSMSRQQHTVGIKTRIRYTQSLFATIIRIRYQFSRRSNIENIEYLTPLL